MSIRAPHLAALGVVLLTGGWLLSHGASVKAMPGVALAATAPATGSSTAGGPTHASATKGSPSSTGPSASAARSHSAASTAAAAAPPAQHGTLLSGTQIAPFTYEIYPAAAAPLSQAEAGFTIAVHAATPGQKKVVITNQIGGVTALAQTFRSTDRAYWIETNYGDDGPGQDANLGDDGFILTDAQGYITQK